MNILNEKSLLSDFDVTSLSQIKGNAIYTCQLFFIFIFAVHNFRQGLQL
jgi:hypothetical protein